MEESERKSEKTLEKILIDRSTLTLKISLDKTTVTALFNLKYELKKGKPPVFYSYPIVKDYNPRYQQRTIDNIKKIFNKIGSTEDYFALFYSVGWKRLI